MSNKSRAIKDCLLDQHIVTGIGNIYSDEILFASKIHPQRPASSLSAKECQRLSKLIPQVLLRAIEQNRISPEEYLKEKGQGYRSTPFFQVYGKKGSLVLPAVNLSVVCDGGWTQQYILSKLSEIVLTLGTDETAAATIDRYIFKCYNERCSYWRWFPLTR